MQITAELVKDLIAAQFPQWSGLPVRPVEKSGHDNRTFHLGDAMSVRLPSGKAYEAQVQKESRWLPYLQAFAGAARFPGFRAARRRAALRAVPVFLVGKPLD